MFPRYALYRSLITIVGASLRPEEDSDNELDARRTLTQTLIELDDKSAITT